MRNPATHALSICTNFTEYEDLLDHHLLSIRSLIASTPDESYPEMASSIADDVNFLINNFTAEEAEDYSGVRDPDVLHSFQLATAYCLTCSEDSSEGDFDPSRECSWWTWRTSRTTTPQATTGTLGRTRGQSNQ